MVNVKEDYKEEQRNKVLAGALECFSSKGYEAATIDDIVNQSGISKGSIYKLFNNKEEIYIGLMYQITNEEIDVIRAILAAHPTAQEKIAALFTEYLSKDLQLRAFLVQSEFELFASRREDILTLLEGIRQTKLQLIADVLKQGMEKGEFKKELDVTVFSELFWAFVDGAITHKLHFPDYPYQEMVKGQKESFMRKIIIHERSHII
ncbi:TetR/AcrR family transcriptional regulator [Pseudoneobacillus sp. C159]